MFFAKNYVIIFTWRETLPRVESEEKIMKRLHLICNAHLDAIWQWTWDEGISAAIATYKSAADLADEFDYILCHVE